MSLDEELAAHLAAMPKVELHHHLEGAAPPALVRRIADEKKLDISRIFDGKGAYEYRDFLQFLDVYEVATGPLTSPEDYARLTRSVLENAREQNVIYLESFLSPDFCGGRDLGAWREYLAAIEDAAASVPGITFRAIVTAIRHFGPDKARETALCAQETAGSFVVGFGIAGDENAGELAAFAYAFDAAREAGLGLTAHAGEWDGPRSIRDALALGVTRIGHGVRAIEDAKLVEYLAAAGIVLEVCPGSNLSLGVYPTLKDHPIARLRDAGVKVTVSTDDPPFFHTDMTREFAALAQTFGWGVDDFSALNRTAADAAFCDIATREHIKTQLESAHD